MRSTYKSVDQRLWRLEGANGEVGEFCRLVSILSPCDRAPRHETDAFRLLWTLISDGLGPSVLAGAYQ